MKPISIVVGNNLRLLIVPDSEAHVNGHPVLTYIYDIFRDKGAITENPVIGEENLVAQEKKANPDYMGYITFEQPEEKFIYVADEDNALTSEEAEQVIEQIIRYRNTPQLWIID